MNCKLPYKYLIAIKCKAKNGDLAPAFYIGKKDEKHAFSFDPMKAIFYDSKTDAKNVGIKFGKIIKIPIEKEVKINGNT